MKQESVKFSGKILQQLHSKRALVQFLILLPNCFCSLLSRNALDDQARTNDGCCLYSEKLVELCKEMDVEAINLWTAIQEKDDWADTCFM